MKYKYEEFKHIALLSQKMEIGLKQFHNETVNGAFLVTIKRT